jgi:hypothetical protein
VIRGNARRGERGAAQARVPSPFDAGQGVLSRTLTTRVAAQESDDGRQRLAMYLACLPSERACPAVGLVPVGAQRGGTALHDRLPVRNVDAQELVSDSSRRSEPPAAHRVLASHTIR